MTTAARAANNHRSVLLTVKMLPNRYENRSTLNPPANPASIGHPVIGDETYGRADPNLGRHFLHAHRLGFQHPVTLEDVEFRSDLPVELQAYLDELE